MIESALTLPCGAVLPNRLAKAALTEGLADAHNRATERHCRLYRRWAQGGAGLLITGNVQVDRRYLERPGNVVIDGNGGLDALRAYAAAGLGPGLNHLWMQINHPGRQAPAFVSPVALAPSAVALNRPGFARPQPMTEADIQDVIARFTRVARIARDTGFTGVQVHAAHGYLISQFLNPLANRREDAWGGALENRARLLRAIVQSVRTAVGADFPVSVKLNSSDFQQGGFSPEECLQVVRWLRQDGVDLLELSGGTYEQASMLGVTQGDSTLRREAYFLEQAALLRPAFPGPLMVTGGFRSRAAMTAALEGAAMDVVGLGRPLINAPESAAALLSGEIRELPSHERKFIQEDAGPQSRGGKPLSALMQSWYVMQLLQMGDGLEPDLAMDLQDAHGRYVANEMATAAALVRD
ncbi:MAG: NADH:flavin oxidoreductase/NADH oxidase family protein [Sulfuricaulis sp.]|nr:NADH:flavin oxidoreductase/NADH oxidase family protein [Sulfuricaulis sp.]